MRPYQREYTVSISDVGPGQELRPSAIFRLFQEVATEHAEEIGVGANVTLNRGILWVVTAQRARIRRAPRYQERVSICTWPGPVMHAFFPRYYQIRSEAGEVLVEASSLWTLMNAVARKMVLPDRDGVWLDGLTTGEELSLPTPPKMGTFTGTHSFAVPYSYLDLNGHMNNIRYFDLAEDILPTDLQGRSPGEICIKYGGEARQGERLDLQTGREGDAWFLSGETGGRRVFRLRLEYGPQNAGATEEKGGSVA